MNNKRYKPLVDKLFWWISVPTVALLAAFTTLALFEPSSLWILIPVDIFCLYFIVSPLFGYAELKEGSVFIKLGLIMKREIPYAKITGISKKRSFISDSMVSLKNSIEHVNIKYNRFDVIALSVIDNDGFIRELEERIRSPR